MMACYEKKSFSQQTIDHLEKFVQKKIKNKTLTTSIFRKNLAGIVILAGLYF